MKYSNITLFVLIGMGLIGCLPTNHHLYSGEVLKRGQEEHSWAVSYPNAYYQVSPKGEYYLNGGTDKDFCKANPKQCTMNWEGIPSISKAWRIGAFDSVGIFPGLEFGFNLEFLNSLGLGSRMGLPSKFSTFKHALGLGWDMGLWIDNTLWSEYTMSYNASPELTLTILNRAMWMATQPGDFSFVDNTMDNHLRTFHLQTVAGLQFNLGNHQFAPSKMHVQISNQWIGMPLLLKNSASLINKGEPIAFKPTFILGLTRN